MSSATPVALPGTAGRRRTARLLRALIGACAVLLPAVLSGCGGSSGPAPVTVFAAASLQPAFTRIAEEFRGRHPGTALELSFAGSSELATQLTEGARADVFASANGAQMARVGDAGLLAGKAVPFASNTLVIVTAPGNPKGVESFADLARPGLAVVRCQQPVPCGSAAQRIEDSTRVRITPVSEEPDVTDVLNKVISGQADAGLVYQTDAISAQNKVATVKFPEAADAVNTYPIAVLKDAPQPGPAQDFVNLVTGEAGQRILRAAGFAEP